MPIHYTIDSATGIIDEIWSGRITCSDLRTYWKAALADPAVLQSRRTVADLREAEIDFTGADLDELVKTILIPTIGELDWKTAIVVKRPVQFGVARQYQAFAGRYSTDSIFDDVSKARAWLTSLARVE